MKKDDHKKPDDLQLHKINLTQVWPSLPPDLLYRMEIEQDPAHHLLTPEKIEGCVEHSIQFGQMVAKKQNPIRSPKDLLNKLLHHRIQIILIPSSTYDSSTPPESASMIRAQYINRPPTIHVHNSSIQQCCNFFKIDSLPVRKEEILSLHLCHEWFHYLESRHYGHTSQHIPKATVRRLGPISRQRPIQRGREIAAHVFTQHMLSLPWTPLLLDHLLTLHSMGWKKGTIREHFAHLKKSKTPVMYPKSAAINP